MSHILFVLRCVLAWQLKYIRAKLGFKYIVNPPLDMFLSQISHMDKY